MVHIVEALVIASERAACIARSCCTGLADETLLVAEKCEGEANARFERDFKTIADVLAQECAKRDIALLCPNLGENVRGEECAEIDGVCIKLKETEEKTAELLNKLVPRATAKRMAEAAHCELKPVLDNLPDDLPNLNGEDLGVWIDPIDATAQFIAGVRGEADADCGLPCVTVLIGAYMLSTGEPVVGVINQPFFNDNQGRVVWGISYGAYRKWGGGESNVNFSTTKTVLLSGAEKPEITEKFKSNGWEVTCAPGAGNKLLKVVLGEASAYIVTKGTTFRWDTCGPHAILRAKGGDVLCYTTENQITYNDPLNSDTKLYANSEGIIAYSDSDILEEIKRIIN